MLKNILINQKKLPVPVPIQTLNDAVRWVEGTFVPNGHTITSISFNGQIITDMENPIEGDTVLHTHSVLEFRIESPVDLAVQTLDAVRNLASVLLSGLKPLAVKCWQAQPVQKPKDVDGVCNDLDLTLDLIEHFTSLIDGSQLETAAFEGIAVMLKQVSVSVQMARSNSDWRGFARLLLNRLEPLLKDLMTDSESLQIRLMAVYPQSSFAKSG